MPIIRYRNTKLLEYWYENDGVVYFKTVNHHILGHMNDFKFCLDCRVYYHNDQFENIYRDKKILDWVLNNE